MQQINQSPVLCGKAGDACRDCGETLSCVLGECTCDSQACNPGCCKDNVCLWGYDDDACGNTGTTCIDCTTTHQECDWLVAKCVDPE